MYSCSDGWGYAIKAELRSILEGLKVIERLGSRRLVVEVDTKVIIDWLKEGRKGWVCCVLGQEYYFFP